MNFLLSNFISVFLLFACAFLSGANVLDTLVTENAEECQPTVVTSCFLDSSLYGVDECLPQLTTHSSACRQQPGTKKGKKPYRFNSPHIRAVNVAHTGIYNFIQRKSLIVHSSFINPDSRLIRLGKLLI